MRIFLAGASGVIGVRLIPLLLAGGHEVARRTVELLEAPSGVYVFAEGG